MQEHNEQILGLTRWKLAAELSATEENARQMQLPAEEVSKLADACGVVIAITAAAPTGARQSPKRQLRKTTIL